MKKHLLGIFFALSVAACGGGSVQGPNQPPADPSNPGTAEEALAKGLEAFRNRDLAGARDAFCKELPDEPNDSRLAFGCFWAKTMLLPANPALAAIFGVFGEDFAVDVDYYGPAGVFTNLELVDRPGGDFFPQFNYVEFDLPFAQRMRETEMGSVLSTLIQLALDHGVSLRDLQGMMEDFIPVLEELAVLSVPILADPAFSFTLPKELFHRDSDVEVTPNDTVLFTAAVEATIFKLQLLTAYDFGVDLGKSLIEGAGIDEKALLEDLNGSGATVHGKTMDTVAFLTLIDGERITASKDRFLRACTLAKQGLAQLEAGELSAFFTPARGESSLKEPIELMEDLIASSTQGLTPLRLITSQAVGLNLLQFFAHPPDAAAMSTGAGDPFVLSGDRLTGVESYFRAFFDGILSF